MQVNATVNAPLVRLAMRNLSPGTVYFWRVVAIVGNNSVGGGFWSFVTPGESQPLTPPFPVWPTSGASGVGTSLTLQWAPVPGATQYQIYFGNIPNTLALYATVRAPTVTEALRNLKSGTTYSWQVVAFTPAQSIGGEIVTFTTQ
jgi:hypothetical protein